MVGRKALMGSKLAGRKGWSEWLKSLEGSLKIQGQACSPFICKMGTKNPEIVQTSLQKIVIWRNCVDHSKSKVQIPNMQHEILL